MLSLAEYKHELSTRIGSYLLLRDLALISSEYLVPRIVWDRAAYRDMWMYYLLRCTDYLAIPEALRALPDPKPDYDRDSLEYVKWEVKRVERLDEPVLYPPCDVFGIYDEKNGLIYVKQTGQRIFGYELSEHGTEITDDDLYYNSTPYTHPAIVNKPDILTFRVLYQEAANQRIHNWERVMGLDLIGVFPDTGCGIFGVADLS